jgi:hypothetical protein
MKLTLSHLYFLINSFKANGNIKSFAEISYLIEIQHVEL